VSELKIRQVRKLFNKTQLTLTERDSLKVRLERAKNERFLHGVRNKLRPKKNANHPELLEQLSEGLERQATINKASETGIFEDPNPFVKPGGILICE
jgi:hypothetical protein